LCRDFLRKDENVPVFFAYAEDDEFKPSIMAIQWLYTITADPSKKLVHYPTGGHGADIFPVHRICQTKLWTGIVSL
jgi:hypothetical protein